METGGGWVPNATSLGSIGKQRWETNTSSVHGRRDSSFNSLINLDGPRSGSAHRLPARFWLGLISSRCWYQHNTQHNSGLAVRSAADCMADEVMIASGLVVSHSLTGHCMHAGN